jgi:hypothetical protein
VRFNDAITRQDIDNSGQPAAMPGRASSQPFPTTAMSSTPSALVATWSSSQVTRCAQNQPSQARRSGPPAPPALGVYSAWWGMIVLLCFEVYRQVSERHLLVPCTQRRSGDSASVFLGPLHRPDNPLVWRRADESVWCLIQAAAQTVFFSIRQVGVDVDAIDHLHTARGCRAATTPPPRRRTTASAFSFVDLPVWAQTDVPWRVCRCTTQRVARSTSPTR